ncbi:MAG: tRNA epoxyqueuosine(34) reductase QueG [bacterium]|nr:tRNA epoxyqueuosine(34) reductase QueG [bacterium]
MTAGRLEGHDGPARPAPVRVVRRPVGRGPAPDMPPEDLRRDVLEAGRRAGLAAVGVAPVEVFESSRRILRERKAQGYHGGMQFTYRNPERSTDPARIVPGATSLVVGALNYSRPAEPGSGLGRPMARVARYASGDVYGELRSALGAVVRVLMEAGHRAVVVADDNALVDREAAYRAGLGYYGKNSNLLLAESGSWFVLGTVVTDAVLPPAAEQVPDGCGPCRRCLDGCPTGAIVAPGVVDARRCLAWLLQATGDFPAEFRAALGDRLYGCDDCQEVCPPNRRLPEAADPGEEASVDVLELLATGDEELMERHGRWYIPERAPRYLRRNALVVLGNTAEGTDPEVVGTLRRYQRHTDPMLVRHATWAAQRLGLGPDGATAPATGDRRHTGDDPASSS